MYIAAPMPVLSLHKNSEFLIVRYDDLEVPFLAKIAAPSPECPLRKMKPSNSRLSMFKASILMICLAAPPSKMQWSVNVELHWTTQSMGDAVRRSSRLIIGFLSVSFHVMGQTLSISPPVQLLMAFSRSVAVSKTWHPAGGGIFTPTTLAHESASEQLPSSMFMLMSTPAQEPKPVQLPSLTAPPTLATSQALLALQLVPRTSPMFAFLQAEKPTQLPSQCTLPVKPAHASEKAQQLPAQASSQELPETGTKPLTQST
mmetsp:Transcript_36438/g.79343  ORF Transcript_36438/g.79343 Transcript_36438/m.79343 type:complete len:258 (-) Transcript_36438:899-1672(-)